MINLFNTHIDSLSIHRVGNKSRNEALFLSEKTFNLNDELVPPVKEFFFKPFREKEENYYQFAHDVDLEYNEMYQLASEIFQFPLNRRTYPKYERRHIKCTPTQRNR